MEYLLHKWMYKGNLFIKLFEGKWPPLAPLSSWPLIKRVYSTACLRGVIFTPHRPHVGLKLPKVSFGNQKRSKVKPIIREGLKKTKKRERRSGSLRKDPEPPKFLFRINNIKACGKWHLCCFSKFLFYLRIWFVVIL